MTTPPDELYLVANNEPEMMPLACRTLEQADFQSNALGMPIHTYIRADLVRGHAGLLEAASAVLDLIRHSNGVYDDHGRERVEWDDIEEVGLLAVAIAAAESGCDGWLPIESAPRSETFLAYWPAYWLADDGSLSDNKTGDGYIGAAEMDGIANVSEPDALNAIGDFHGDDWEYGLATHWRPLPPPPTAVKAEA